MIQIGDPSATIDKPIEHLMACHRRIEQRLDTLVRAADHLERDRDAALGAVSKSLQFLDSSGVLHTRDEEDSLFPRLRARLSADDSAYLDSLETQHVRADSLLARLKQLIDLAAQSRPVPADIIDQYRACAQELRGVYAEHIRSEDTLLNALAKQSLGESDLSEIAGEMRQRRAARSR